MSVAERNQAISLCTDLLKQIGWDWNTPRVRDWLDRVMKIKYKQELISLSAVPTRTFVSLAVYLDLRWQCHIRLTSLNLNWQSPVVNEIRQQYGTVDTLPAKGYRQLLEELDMMQALDPIPF